MQLALARPSHFKVYVHSKSLEPYIPNGADVVLTGGSIVLSNVPTGRVMMGYPATKIDRQVESYKALRRLPRLMRDLATSRKG